MRVGRLKVPYRIMGEAAFRRHDRIAASHLKSSDRGFDIVHCWPLGSATTLEVARRMNVISFLERPNTHTEYAYATVDSECRRLGFTLNNRNSHRVNAHRLRREVTEYNLADRIACPSEFVATTFTDRGFSALKLARHQYGYDPSAFAIAVDSLDNDGPFTAAFVASCEPRKGLHFLVDAWFASGAAECGKLRIVGRFVPGYRELLGDALSHPSISVEGFSTDVAQVLRESHVLVLPSIEEGSALVTYEARACGCALLVSDATGAPCLDGVHGLVHRAGRVDELAEHLRLVLNNRGLLGRLREQSVRGATQLTWSAAAERLKALYINAIEEPAMDTRGQ